jgi:hypothetical protein
MNKSMLPRLSFPQQNPPQEGSFFLSTPQTNKWLGGLGSARLGKGSHELFRVLHSLNRTELQPLARLEITELFIAPVLQYARKLETHLLRSSFPLKEKDLKISQLIKGLLLELALSFKILLCEQLQKRTSLTDLALSSQRVLSLHLASLRQVALSYHNYPRNFWQETHQVYKAAMSANVSRMDVFNDIQANPGVTQLEAIYKQIMLFSLSDHYRLRQSDIILIYKTLPEWSQDVILKEQHDRGDDDNLFFVDLNRNTPALHLSLLDNARTHEQECIYMDTEALIRHLSQCKDSARLNNLSGQLEAGGISTRIYEHLAFVWKMLPPRHSARTNLRYELTMAVGLKAISTLLHQAQRENPAAAEQLPPDIAHRVSSADESSGMLIDLDSNFWKIDSPDITHIDDLIFLEHGSDTPSWTQRDSLPVEPMSFRIINESSGGYCISWKDQGAPAIKVGELLGIQHEQKKHMFSLAVSRWMKYEQGHNLLGIALLSRSSYPIQARLSDHGLVHHCILLGEFGTCQIPRLASPPLAFRANQTITLFNPNLRITVRLIELMEGSAAFNIFSYEELSLSDGQEEVASNPVEQA